VTLQAILSEVRNCGVRLSVEGEGLRYRAPRGALTPQLRQALTESKADIINALLTGEGRKQSNAAKSELGTLEDNLPLRGSSRPTSTDLAAGEIGAVLMKSAVLDNELVWLVANYEALSEHPDIIRSGYPVFFFEEVEHLRRKSPDELRVIAETKRCFPTGRVLQ
jgi:TubC N-terminal docking domain